MWLFSFVVHFTEVHVMTIDHVDKYRLQWWAILFLTNKLCKVSEVMLFGDPALLLLQSVNSHGITKEFSFTATGKSVSQCRSIIFLSSILSVDAVYKMKSCHIENQLTAPKTPPPRTLCLTQAAITHISLKNYFIVPGIDMLFLA
jgi:hypothetical protein